MTLRRVRCVSGRQADELPLLGTREDGWRPGQDIAGEVVGAGDRHPGRCIGRRRRLGAVCGPAVLDSILPGGVIVVFGNSSGEPTPFPY